MNNLSSLIFKPLSIYKKQILITLISFILATGIFLISQLDGITLQLFFLVILVLVYLFYLSNLDLFDTIYNIVYASLFIYCILTLSRRKLFGISAINYLYIIDFLLLYLSLRVIGNISYWRQMIMDRFLNFYSILVLISSVYGLIHGCGLQNCLLVIWIYVRMLPIYIGLRYSDKWFGKKDVIYFLVLNITIMPLQIFKFPQDDLAGLFGYCGNTAFSLIAVIIFLYGLIRYTKSEITLKKFCLFFLFYFLWAALGENKFQIIFGGLIIIVTLIFTRLPQNRKSKSFLNRIYILIMSPIVMGLSVIILMKLYPEWKYILDIGFFEFFNSYTQQANVGFYKLGRLQVIKYINTYIFHTNREYLFGLGIGNGMPGIMAPFHVFDHVMKIPVENYMEIFTTNFYNQYGWSLGYHNSGLGILYLENGLIGLILYFLSLSILTIRCFKKLKYKDNYINTIGELGLMFLIYWIAIFSFYNPIFELRCSCIFFCVCAWISRSLSPKNIKFENV